ncbi:hypothetical protein [Pseudomonas tohonis]|uniref:hypothetical protein n=1 Tax=Pseudomonas tohonis TaxID=2725477 RepID=UPI0021D8235E|nr:hypothetical protein [Pseudomonas tohonis]UXY55411.1 hypothetical protein N9L84_12830 [Pseudomonas tohonis]
MLETAGLDPRKAPAAGGGVDKWIPVMILSDAKQDASKSHLAKSIVKNTDDRTKRANYLQMVDSLFRAITQDDFGSLFAGDPVTYKSAHSFKFKNKNETLRELKRGKKDRIYVFPYDGKLGRYVFVLEALHKDQQTTPDHIKNYAESAIKVILEAHNMDLII